MSAKREQDAVDIALIDLLGSGSSPTDAASAVGVSVRTVHRRMGDIQFRIQVLERRADRWRTDAERFRVEVCKSIDRLIALRDGGGHPSTVLRASIAIIELAVQFNDLVNTAPRMAALEAALEEWGGRETHGPGRLDGGVAGAARG